jgi:hypothetical protein
VGVFAMSPQKHGGSIEEFDMALQRAVRHYIALATDPTRPVKKLQPNPSEKSLIPPCPDELGLKRLLAPRHR